MTTTKKKNVICMPSNNLLAMSFFSVEKVMMVLVLIVAIASSRPTVGAATSSSSHYSSAVGDPGMTREGLRVAFEAWNFCNEVGEEAPMMGSPRAADCFDVVQKRDGIDEYSSGYNYSQSQQLAHKVSKEDNKLGIGKPFPGLKPEDLNNPDLYAAQKEIYLGNLCQVVEDHEEQPWQFWMVMLKNGNFDTTSGLCPQNGRKVGPFPPPSSSSSSGGKLSTSRFPCFGRGCMNQPLLYHQPTNAVVTTSNNTTLLRGSFRGTYDLESRHNLLGANPVFAQSGKQEEEDISYYEVLWEKELGILNSTNISSSSWRFKHKLKTSPKYPWLMLYLRADATSGFSGGYHYNTRGMLKILPKSPNFKVRMWLEVKRGGGPKSQFYLIDIGSCWKNNGKTCDGDVLSDVTRYSEMIINPETPAWCSPSNLRACPPYHITPNDTKIHRNDTAHFPYGAYHYYCGPGNALHLEQPADTCDPYSNPQAQEIVQLLPHPIWAEYGYPTKPGQGWIGDPTSWDLNVGALSSRLYFYQDPNTAPAERIWTSIDTGTEIFISNSEDVAEWTVSDFDVILTS